MAESIRPLVSTFCPRSGFWPTGMSSLPVGRKAILMGANTLTWPTTPMARAASSSGVRRVRAATRGAPARTIVPAGSTVSSSGLKENPSTKRRPSPSRITSSMAMTVSKASGKSSPVSARTKSRPFTHLAVSGRPWAKSAFLTATPSKQEARTTGRVFTDTSSSAVTLPRHCARGRVSIPGAGIQCSFISCRAWARVTLCSNWNFIRFCSSLSGWRRSACFRKTALKTKNALPEKEERNTMRHGAALSSSFSNTESMAVSLHTRKCGLTAHFGPGSMAEL